MSALLKGVGAITLFVEDLGSSRSFYRDLLGMRLAYEDDNSVVFSLENTLINLLKVSAVGDLIQPGTVAARGVGSRFQLTIWVDDTDAVCADLTTRGVVLLNGPIDREWGKRTACFADPDGNLWEVAQDLPRTPGS